MKLSDKYLKIASQIYTYLKSAGEDFQNKRVDVQQSYEELKTLLLSEKQIQFCDYLNSLQNVDDVINKRDNKKYTLLMLAASNNLAQITKCLLEKKADPYLTIDFTGSDFRKVLNFKIKNNLLDEQEIQQANQNRHIQATAFDIAMMKNNTQIVNLLKIFF